MGARGVRREGCGGIEIRGRKHARDTAVHGWSRAGWGRTRARHLRERRDSPSFSPLLKPDFLIGKRAGPRPSSSAPSGPRGGISRTCTDAVLPRRCLVASFKPVAATSRPRSERSLHAKPRCRHLLLPGFTPPRALPGPGGGISRTGTDAVLPRGRLVASLEPVAAIPRPSTQPLSCTSRALDMHASRAFPRPNHRLPEQAEREYSGQACMRFFPDVAWLRLSEQNPPHRGCIWCRFCARHVASTHAIALTCTLPVAHAAAPAQPGLSFMPAPDLPRFPSCSGVRQPTFYPTGSCECPVSHNTPPRRRRTRSTWTCTARGGPSLEML